MPFVYSFFVFVFLVCLLHRLFLMHGPGCATSRGQRRMDSLRCAGKIGKCDRASRSITKAGLRMPPQCPERLSGASRGLRYEALPQ